MNLNSCVAKGGMLFLVPCAFFVGLRCSWGFLPLPCLGVVGVCGPPTLERARPAWGKWPKLGKMSVSGGNIRTNTLSRVFRADD